MPDSSPHSESVARIRDALSRLMIPDYEALAALDNLVEQLETLRRHDEAATQDAVFFRKQLVDAREALRRIADLTSQEVQFAAVGGEGGVMRRIAREALNPATSPPSAGTDPPASAVAGPPSGAATGPAESSPAKERP